jgi:hypothetical protein
MELRKGDFYLYAEESGYPTQYWVVEKDTAYSVFYGGAFQGEHAADIVSVILQYMVLEKLYVPLQSTGEFYKYTPLPHHYKIPLGTVLGDKFYLNIYWETVEKGEKKKVRFNLWPAEKVVPNWSEWELVSAEDEGVDIDWCLDVVHAVQDFILEEVA